MLNNTITIPSMVTATGAAREVVFTRIREELDKTTYHGPTHTPAVRELLQFYRSAPKQNGNFRGTAKTAMKLTRDVTVTGVDGNPVIAPMIIEVSFSIPIGVLVDVLDQAVIDTTYGIYQEGANVDGVIDSTSMLRRLTYTQEI